MNLEQYKELAEKLNAKLDQEGFSISELMFENIDELAIDMNDGSCIHIKGGWDSEIHRFNEDKPEFWYYTIEPNDEYALFVEGYYDSWSGSQIENHEIKVGKIEEKMIKYTIFNKV